MFSRNLVAFQYPISDAKLFEMIFLDFTNDTY
jgi:hypothetical protein